MHATASTTSHRRRCLANVGDFESAGFGTCSSLMPGILAED